MTDPITGYNARGEPVVTTKPARTPRADTREDIDRELEVMRACAHQLSTLSPESASRVLLYLARRYGGEVLPSPIPGSDEW